MYIYRKDGYNRFSDGIGHRTPSLVQLQSTKDITFVKICKYYMKLAEELSNAADTLEKQIDSGIREYLFLRNNSVGNFLEWRTRFRFFLPGAAWDLVNMSTEELEALKKDVRVVLPYKATIYSKISHQTTNDQDLASPASRILNDYTMHSTYIECLKRLDDVVKKVLSISVKIDQFKLNVSSTATEQFRHIEHHFNQQLSPEEIRHFVRKNLRDLFVGELYQPNYICRKQTDYHYSFASLYELMSYLCMLYENYSVEDPLNVHYFVFAVTLNFVRCFGQSLLEVPDLYKFMSKYEPNSFAPDSLTANDFITFHRLIRSNLYRARKVCYTSAQIADKREVMLRRRKLINYSKPPMEPVVRRSSNVSTDPRLAKRPRTSSSVSDRTTATSTDPAAPKEARPASGGGGGSGRGNSEESKGELKAIEKTEEPVDKPGPNPSPEPAPVAEPAAAGSSTQGPTNDLDPESDSEIEIIEEILRPT